MKRLLPTVLAFTAILSIPIPGAEQDVSASAQIPIAEVRDAVHGRGAVCGNFTESRKFSFRRDPVLLHGHSSYIPGKGLLLEYDKPEKRIIGITEKGIIETDSGGKRTIRDLPRQYDAMLAVYDFDIDTLEQDFDIRLEGSVASWTLLLTEKTSPLKPGRGPKDRDTPVSIAVSGDNGQVRELKIAKPGSITIEIRMENTRPLSEEEKEATASRLEP